METLNQLQGYTQGTDGSAGRCCAEVDARTQVVNTFDAESFLSQAMSTRLA